MDIDGIGPNMFSIPSKFVKSLPKTSKGQKGHFQACESRSQQDIHYMNFLI